MKVRIIKSLGFFIISISMLFTGGALAQSAKATASVGNIGILDSQDMQWSTIMENDIRMANKKDLFMSASLECGLYTQTQVKGKQGERDSASAEAKVMLRVLVDGQEAKPGAIVYCERAQELTAVLGGVLEECTDANGDGTIMSDECLFSDEEIELVLKTMSANSFNFILDNLGSGMHNIKVQAKIESASESGQGSASAKASIGHGSIVIEEVRMTNDEVIDF